LWILIWELVFFPLDPEWEKNRTWDPGSEKNIPDLVSNSLLKIVKFFVVDPGQT
jgi:hypothetical protein